MDSKNVLFMVYASLWGIKSNYNFYSYLSDLQINTTESKNVLFMVLLVSFFLGQNCRFLQRDTAYKKIRLYFSSGKYRIIFR